MLKYFYYSDVLAANVNLADADLADAGLILSRFKKKSDGMHSRW